MFDGYQSNQNLQEVPAALHPASSTLTQQTRQHRLQQLTTQLLWRLQQSSPHHTSSATNTILPSLPEALPELLAPQQPAKLLHGLEESQGALYEIGVSDDGTLVGLAEDEMSESLNNLRAMAACLGCTVEVLRNETVGECEWLEDAVVGKKERKMRRSGKLLVAEALIKPFLQTSSSTTMVAENEALTALPSSADLAPPVTEQLRVTLTGPTMCGKSTLLGTLVTSTLDNGRGKSRLSMLKHRHEITSGITSSVTQELLGYKDAENGDLEVVNFATENVASWIDIHAAAAGNRMVFISDSAGHPRYRRTTLRGLVGWAPHWTLLCIPADDTEDSAEKNGGTNTSQQFSGTTVHDMDLSGAQLDLCLRLDLPLVVVITKLDLASRTGLRQSLTKVLDALKAAGKKPAILPNKSGAVADERDLQFVKTALLDSAFNAAVPLLNDARHTVPIVLTSALDGTGIANLHALLHELPIPDALPSNVPSSSLIVFDVEDVYSKPAEVAGVIISGRLRAGTISVGDTAVIGPFSSLDSNEDSEDSDERPFRRTSSHLQTSRSFPGAFRGSHLLPAYFQPNQEWRRVKLLSARNLRLPVHSLHTDQVGTLAIALDDDSDSSSTPSFTRIRKGMVLTTVQPLATRTFTAKFQREDLTSLAVSSHVVVYISSIRASARVVSAREPDTPSADGEHRRESNGDESFKLDDVGRANVDVVSEHLLVTLAFESSKEFVVVGDRVLVMPGGGPGLFGGSSGRDKGLAGLEGFVGEIVEIRG
jgi:GTPase